MLPAPPTNQSHVHQWSVGTYPLPPPLLILTISPLPPGPVFYAALVVTETIGPTGTAQLVDLNANNGNLYTPAYAIYEQGNIARIALFNYITDPTGGNTYTASISVGGGGTLGSVKVKYLAAASVAQKHNITWANQVCVREYHTRSDLDLFLFLDFW